MTISQRTFLKTEQFAALLCRSPQTVRALHCATGEAFGIKPVKIGRLLMWPAAAVDAVLAGEPQPKLRTVAQK